MRTIPHGKAIKHNLAQRFLIQTAFARLTDPGRVQNLGPEEHEIHWLPAISKAARGLLVEVELDVSDAAEAA